MEKGGGTLEKIDLKGTKNLSFSIQKRYKKIAASGHELLPDCDKEKVLKYLNSYSAVLFTSARVFDGEKKENVEMCNNTFFDGIYEWDAQVIYDFENYNLKLEKEFIKHVLN